MASLSDLAVSAATAVPVLGELTVAAGAVKSTFLDTAYELRGFVQQFNPATTGLFDMAMRDLTATIGYETEPILQFATRVVRDLADSLFADGGKMRGALQELADDLGETWKEAQPGITAAVKGLTLLTQTAVQLNKALHLTEIALAPLIALGGLGTGAEKQSTVGLGGAPVQVTDPLSAFRQFQEGALQGPKADLPKATESTMREILKTLTEIDNWLTQKFDISLGTFTSPMKIASDAGAFIARKMGLGGR